MKPERKRASNLSPNDLLALPHILYNIEAHHGNIGSLVRLQSKLYLQTLKKVCTFALLLRLRLVGSRSRVALTAKKKKIKKSILSKEKKSLLAKWYTIFP